MFLSLFLPLLFSCIFTDLYAHRNPKILQYRRTSLKSGLRSLEWARSRGMEPGFGGIWPGSPSAKKYNVTILSNGTSYTAQVPSDRYIYFYFEELGIDLPVVNKNRMCRQGGSKFHY